MFVRSQVDEFPRVPDFMGGSGHMWIKDLAGVLGWLGFLGLVLLVVWAEHSHNAARRRTLTNVFLLYTVGLAGAVGFFGREMWPFSQWSMIPDVRTAEVGATRVFGIDEGGGEHVIDVRAWHPLQWAELHAWLTLRFPTLSSTEQSAAVDYLLVLANRARSAAAHGETPGYLDRYFGPLTVPEHLLQVRAWPSPESVPSRPFVAIRVVREWWSVETGRTNPDLIRRQVIFEPPVTGGS